MSAGRSSPFAVFGVAAALIVAGAVALSVYAAVHPLIGYAAGINLAAFFLYGIDKSAAERNRLRVPEKVLHAVALLGGSPAALLAQQVFRHKTSKTSFRVSFWLIVVVQVAAIAALLWWRQHPPAWLPASWR